MTTMHGWVNGAAAIALWIGAASVSAEDRHLLIERDREARVVESIVLEQQELSFIDASGVRRSRSTSDLIALLRLETAVRRRAAGVLLLDDGQRFPGTLTGRTAAADDGFVWLHPWLGQVEFSMERVRTMVLDTARASVAAPVSGAVTSDVVLLRNGDRIEGFLVSVGDPFVLEVPVRDGVRMVEIAMDRVAAVRMMTPVRAALGERAWFRDGTVLETGRRQIGDDGFLRVATPWIGPERSLQIGAQELSGIFFDVAAMTPLSAHEPEWIRSPVPRFQVPPPHALEPDAPLGTGPLELRGPIIAAYRLPPNYRRMIAELILPESARRTGDPTFIVRLDGRELSRIALDTFAPTHLLDVSFDVQTDSGRDAGLLELEVREGRSGPVHCRVRLERAYFVRSGGV